MNEARLENNALHQISSTITPATELPSKQLLETLLNYYGIAEAYNDYAGNTVSIPWPNRVKILDLMGVNTSQVSSVKLALRDYESNHFQHWLPPVVVIDSTAENQISLYFAEEELDQNFQWLIQTELNAQHQGDFKPSSLTEGTHLIIKGRKYSERLWQVPALEPGYHQLQLRCADKEISVPLISAPSRCYEPEWAVNQKKLAGVSVQVYTLASDRNWGVGDFSDLLGLINHSADCGLDFLVLNPLHLLDRDAPEHCSPYSPMDRRRLNPLYIDPEIEPDFIENSMLRAHVAKPAFRQRLVKLRALRLVDYSGVSKTKYDVFALMFEHFQQQHIAKNTDRAKAFTAYLAQQDLTEGNFAEFLAQRSKSPLKSKKDPQFHFYLQWIAELQFERCQQQAKSAGMSIGLVRDLAVGGSGDSAEVRMYPDLFCLPASIGAPPDPLAPQGQNWGLPPMRPNVLRRTGYHHFIELLKTNMTHCGALRIDHVMSLMRLWWCPGQSHTGEGAYVHYPVNDLFAILRLESQRNCCVVIGEDLGVVPPEVRCHMNESAVFSNALFYFEKYDGVSFKRPPDMPQKALTMVANHDVPTLAAWWNKSDLNTRKAIGLITDEESYLATLGERDGDLLQVLLLLKDAGLLPESWQDMDIQRPFDIDLCSAIMQVNGRCNSQLVSVQLEDLCLMESPVNIPGTSHEYPNWRRKIGVSVDWLLNQQHTSSLLREFVNARQRP